VPSWELSSKAIDRGLDGRSTPALQGPGAVAVPMYEARCCASPDCALSDANGPRLSEVLSV
jgi:hypothetical protein